MSYGTVVPDGHLPVFSVDTPEDAKLLIASACELSSAKQYVARELMMDQTLENLAALSDRLAGIWELIESRRKNDGRRNSKRAARSLR